MVESPSGIANAQTLKFAEFQPDGIVQIDMGEFKGDSGRGLVTVFDRAVVAAGVMLI